MTALTRSAPCGTAPQETSERTASTVLWAGEAQFPVFHRNPTCNTAAPTNHHHRASMAGLVLTSTQQVPPRDVHKGNNSNNNNSSKNNQHHHRFWAVELIRRPWGTGQMREVEAEAEAGAEATAMPATMTIQGAASHRSWASCSRVRNDHGTTMVRAATKMMTTMIELCSQVATRTVSHPKSFRGRYRERRRRHSRHSRRNKPLHP